MRVWMWQWNDDSWCVSPSYPTQATEDNPLHRVRKGQWLAGAGCPMLVNPPGDLRPLLPGKDEPREMLFHEELWGKAKELPSYDKRTWTNLQAALGD